MNVVVLDTDAASSLLRGRPSAALSDGLLGQIPAITFVTLGELTKWTMVRRWGPRRLTTMRMFPASMLELP